jgi:hypothetical protein
LGLGVEVEAIGKPGNDEEHAEPTELTGEVTNLLVVREDAPLREENGPVAFVAIDKRKVQGAGIGHVGADVEKIFEEPEEGEDEAVGLAVVKEKSGAEEWNEKFAEGAAEDHYCVAVKAEEGMAGFVDDEVGVVEEEEAGSVTGGVEEEEEIESEAECAAETGDGGPVVGAVHEMRVTAAGFGAVDFWGDVV